MPFRVSGKNLDIGEALRARINSRIGEATEQVFRRRLFGPRDGGARGYGFHTECAIHLDSKITLHAEASAPDAYASADQAVLRMEKQLRRYHRRLKDHRCTNRKSGTRFSERIMRARRILELSSAAALSGACPRSGCSLDESGWFSWMMPRAVFWETPELTASTAVVGYPLTRLATLPMVRRLERVPEQRRRLFGKDYAKRQREVWPCSPTIQPASIQPAIIRPVSIAFARLYRAVLVLPSMIRQACPGLIRVDTGFPKKIMRKQMARAE